jgi:CHAD domain-containing protein
VMMSDQRRFVLTGALVGDSRAAGQTPDQGASLATDPTADPLTEVLAVLGRAFTVIRETGAPASAAEGQGARRRTWLDTFDWRLFNAGLLLEHEHARRGGHGGRIILSAADGSLRAEQPATGWQSMRPAPSAAIPPGPVSDIIGSVVSPRALLPVARAVSTREVLRLINADGKTVARLVVERTSTQEHHLPLALEIAEVRGYPGQARRAAALLASVANPAADADFAAVMTHAAAAGQARRPGSYSGKVEADLTAQMPAVVAVVTLLLHLLDTLEQNVDGVLRDIDTEFLHDLRVAVRRTRAAIKLLGDTLPGGLAARYRDEFKWLGDLTTPVRDLDVHLLGFEDLAGSLIAFPAADLEPFRDFLARRRALEFRRLAAGLRSPRFRVLVHDWRKALLEVRDVPGKRQRKQAAAALAAERTGRATAQLLRRGAAIAATSPAESLHDLRKRGKELRYLLEFFAPIFDAAVYRSVISDLKKLQDCLGDFQDSEVQRDEIGVLAQAMLRDSAPQGAARGAAQGPSLAALAPTLLAMGEISARLAVLQQAARADFTDRFARFASPASQRRIHDLLTGGSP